jgi:phage gp36-like protein
MKKRYKSNLKNIEHRGNADEVTRKYQNEISIVRKITTSSVSIGFDRKSENVSTPKS